MQHPRWSTPTPRRALCQQVGETPELVPVLLGLWRFYLGTVTVAHGTRARRNVATPGATCRRPRARCRRPLCPWGDMVLPWRIACCPPAPGGSHRTLHARPAPCSVFRMGQDLGVASRAMPLGTSGCWGTQSKPWHASTRPWRWHTSCRIPLVWRLRGVGRPASRSFVGHAGRARARRGRRRALDRAGLSTVGGPGNELAWVGAGHAGPGRGGHDTGPPGDRRLAGHRGSAGRPIFLHQAGGSL